MRLHLFLYFKTHLSPLPQVGNPQGSEDALLSTQLETQKIHRSWLEGRAAVNSNIPAALSAQGTPARSERRWGTWSVDSITIKENLFHLWV